MSMALSRLTFYCSSLIGLMLGLAVACGAPAQTPTPLGNEASARLFTRTPIPTATPTPTVHPQVVFQQGLAQRRAWNLEAALQRFDTALAVSPSAPFYANRAEVYRLLGRNEDAAADIDQALALDPELAAAWRQKALLSRAVEAWDEALVATDKLIELEPDDGAAFVLRAQIEAQGFGKFQQALADYRRASRRDPALDEATLVERWHVLAELGYWAEALHVSRRMIETGSEDPLNYYYQAWSSIQLGQLDKAIQVLFSGIERYPDDSVAFYYALGVAYYERQAWLEVIQALEVALTQSGTLPGENVPARPLNTSAADILGRMGIAYLKLGQCETGAAIVERAIDEGSNPEEWLWARQSVEACYLSLTPTPTPLRSGTPAP
jgi:tetratricopeptide (TPR) repeat protein